MRGEPQAGFGWTGDPHVALDGVVVSIVYVAGG